MQCWMVYEFSKVFFGEMSHRENLARRRNNPSVCLHSADSVAVDPTMQYKTTKLSREDANYDSWFHVDFTQKSYS